LHALTPRGAGQSTRLLRLADLVLDPATRSAARNGRRIALTAREYALLDYFLRNVDRVLTRPMILQRVWGFGFDPETNIVDVYVRYLRRKIDADGEPRLLRTVRRAGYMLSAEQY
jgi:DNA-binding response OmpR family regulator